MTSKRTTEIRLLQGALLCLLLLIAGYLVLVGTALGHQIDDSAYLGREAMSRGIIQLDAKLLVSTTGAVVLVASTVLVLIAAVRRCFSVGVIAVAGFVCAIAGAELLKDTLPWRALTPSDSLLGEYFQIETYPSGHATVGTAFVLGLLLVSPSRWRPWLAVVAGCISALFSTAVLFTGWHRPSDALGALAWSGLCMNLAAVLAVRFRGNPGPATAKPKYAFWASIILAMLVTAALWLIAKTAAWVYPHGGLLFFAVTGLIVAWAFALTAWFGWQLRAVEFFKPRMDAK